MRGPEPLTARDYIMIVAVALVATAAVLLIAESMGCDTTTIPRFVP